MLGTFVRSKAMLNFQRIQECTDHLIFRNQFIVFAITVTQCSHGMFTGTFAANTAHLAKNSFRSDRF